MLMGVRIDWLVNQAHLVDDHISHGSVACSIEVAVQSVIVLRPKQFCDVDSLDSQRLKAPILRKAGLKQTEETRVSSVITDFKDNNFDSF
jgi:hypothetical protein